MLFTSIIFLILSNAVATRKNTAVQYSRTTFISNFYSMLLIYLVIDWYYFENSISLFNGLLYCSLNSSVFIFFLFMLGFLILILTSFFPTMIINERSNFNPGINTFSINQKHAMNGEEIIANNVNSVINIDIKELLQTKREHYSIIEYPLITLFILTGGITLLSSNDLVTMFLSIELQSYGLYILSTIYRNSESSTNAGLTYFLLGGLASCIILLGQSLLYVNLGHTNLDGIYIIHNIFNSNPDLLTFFLTEAMPQGINQYVPFTSLFSVQFYQYSVQLAFMVMAIGFLVKISASPFHSWSPGVYDAIPTVTTTFVAIIAKISIFILFFDLIYSTGYTTLDYSWKNILLFSSFLSLIIGSVLGLTQFRIKRLYAYSTISHVGFILLALCVQSVESTQAFFFYIIQYSLSNLNAFIILVVIGYTYVSYTKKSRTNETVVQSYKEFKDKITNLSPVEYIDQLKGYFYLNPVLAISFSVTLYSFIGIPPLVGFFAKQMILSSALDNGYVFMCLIAILTSVVSAVYYLYIIKHMFFEKSEYSLDNTLSNLIEFQLAKQFGSSYNNISRSDDNVKSITISSWLTFIISILSLAILLFIFLYHETYFLINILSVTTIY
jgi:NADH-ubiquinone oxidoreductase chain 2